MLRIIFMVIRNLWMVPYMFTRLILAAKRYDGDYMPGFEVCKIISGRAIKKGNIDLEVHGIENLPKENGYIMYPNHQGLFDTLNFFYSSPNPFAAVLKKEAMDVFFLRKVVEATGSLPMDREDLRQSMQVINQVAEEVKAGRNYLIFPEGHRSREGNKLLEFKAGSFKAAQKAKCPIVPCALINSFVPFDEKSIRQVTVKLIYLDPIYYDEYEGKKTQEIATMVKTRIEEAIAKYE